MDQYQGEKRGEIKDGVYPKTLGRLVSVVVLPESLSLVSGACWNRKEGGIFGWGVLRQIRCTA